MNRFNGNFTVEETNLTLCLWSFGGAGTLARYPFPYGFFCIVCAEGF